ncbi:MAG: ABC transporter permease [Rhizobiales bacterium]|nr:ABC transporter permease [Hyphomicrobiales bacterium]
MSRRGWLAYWPLAPAALIFVGLFAAPLAYFLAISFWSVRARVMRPDFTLRNYIATWTDYGDTLASTLLIAFVISLTTTVLAFGFAYVIRFRAGRWGNALLFLTLITLFGGYLVKIYAWKAILGRDGILNLTLINLGLIDAPLDALIYSANAIVITLTYFLLPFAVLPIYSSMRAISDVTLEASRDLGAGFWRTLRNVVTPQCERGILVAFTFTFLISAGDYVTPRFVGGGAAMMGQFIETQFSIGFNWPMGSAMAFTVMACSLATVLAFRAALRQWVKP